MPSAPSAARLLRPLRAPLRAWAVIVAVLGVGAGLSGCVATSDPPVEHAPLSRFPSPSLVGTTARFTLDYDMKPACLGLPASARATVNGHPATLAETGSYTRTSCGGDCAAQGGNGRLSCLAPVFVSDFVAPAGVAVVLELSDGTTTFRAELAPVDALTLAAPLGRSLAVGDRVTFKTALAATQIVGPALEFASGGAVTGMEFDRDTMEHADGEVSYLLRAGDCTGLGTTRDALVAFDIKREARACEGGLLVCAFTDRTPQVPVSLAFPASSPGCR